MFISGRKVREGSLEIEGVDSRDYPDFCDAYFSYAEYEDGGVLSDIDLEELTTEYGDVLNMMACEDLGSSAEDRCDYLRDR